MGQAAQTVPQETNVHEIVLRELQHRVANTLTILQAGCHFDFAGIADPMLREKLRRHEQRIRGLAELHHFLSRGAGRGKVAATKHFRALCSVLSRSILAPLGFHCEVRIGEGTLDGRACEWLGLIVAELVMNAAKHAFSGCRDGRVWVEICPTDSGWCCTVADNGCGKPSGTGGTGSLIVNALLEMLDGRMSVDTSRAGTTVTILFPAIRSGHHSSA